MVDLEGCVSYADDQLEEQDPHYYILVRYPQDFCSNLLADCVGLSTGYLGVILLASRGQEISCRSTWICIEALQREIEGYFILLKII